MAIDNATKKPLIGIVLDRETNGDYSRYPYYVLREHYFAAVEKAGGIPIGLGLDLDMITEYRRFCDGLLLPGGDYDIPPAVYGEAEVHESVVTKTERLEFDMAITKAFMADDKPVLGICAGHQLLAVVNGGRLVQHIPNEIPEALSHYEELRDVPAHAIEIKEGTKLHEITGKTHMMVNSHHHQAVRADGGDFIVCATSSDGVVEAIEMSSQRFCLGLEWHPEFLINEDDLRIFEAFITAATHKKA